MNSTGGHLGEIGAVEMWVKKSRLFTRWQAMKHEIELHKWYESEKAGHDIGWDQAATSWQMHYGRLPEKDGRR